MMTTPLEIKLIEYRWGMYQQSMAYNEETLSKGLRLEATEIPSDVLESLISERILEFQGDFGDPKVGDPVEVDLLRIDTRSASHEIRVFNRGIMLFLIDDEQMRRLHRFLGKLRHSANQES